MRVRPYLLFVKLVNRLILHHGCAFGDLVAKLCRLCPANRVGDDLLHVSVVIRGAGLVTGLEVEHLARAAQVAKTAAENKAVLKPRAEYQRIGLRYVEGLAVKLLGR